MARLAPTLHKVGYVIWSRVDLSYPSVCEHRDSIGEFLCQQLCMGPPKRSKPSSLVTIYPRF